MVTLDILSDPICPWCYIGKSQLDRALSDHPDHPFKIEWHPFQLNPDMPREGMDRRDYLERKFGGKDGAVRVYSKIEEHAKALGLPIDFAAMKRTPNTVDAHRLIHWAGLEGKQSALVDALFDGYFCQGTDIGDKEVLAQMAGEIGMDQAAMLRLLQGDVDVKLVQERDAHSRQMGVNSVPTYIVANKHAVPGAQPPELWAQVIKDVESQMAAD